MLEWEKEGSTTKKKWKKNMENPSGRKRLLGIILAAACQLEPFVSQAQDAKTHLSP